MRLSRVHTRPGERPVSGAYSLTGRQDAAERLLQAALEMLALRWRRTEDPFLYAVTAMRRLALPWWKRYVPFLRRGASPVTPHGATGGRVVDVGDLALAGRHRRRLRRAGLVVAAVGVAAGLAAAVSLMDLRVGQDPREGADLTGMSVVSSFNDSSWQVLDVSTGEYVPASEPPTYLSPDLATVVEIAGGGCNMIVAPAVGDRSEAELVRLGVQAAFPRWSPDGRTVAAIAWIGTATFTAVVLADVTTGRATTVDLKFPDHRAGWVPTAVLWRNADELVVPTVDMSLPPLPPRPHSGESYEPPTLVGLSIFGRDGSLVDEMPLDYQDSGDGGAPHAGLMWIPFDLIRDGTVLLSRRPSEREFQLTTMSLAGDTGSHTPVSVALPEHDLTVAQPDDSTSTFGSLTANAYAWLPNGQVLVEIARSQRADTLIVDLSSGDVEVCAAPCPASALGAMLGVDLPVPPTATQLTFSDADAARHPENLTDVAFRTG